MVDDADLTPDMIPEPRRVEVVLADGRRRTAEVTRTPGHPRATRVRRGESMDPVPFGVPVVPDV